MYFVESVLVIAELSLQPDMTAVGVRGVTAGFEEQSPVTAESRS